MESNSTMTSGALDTTCAHARAWRDRLQPGTRLLADPVVTVQGTTLPITDSGKAGLVGRVAVPDATAFGTTLSNGITSNASTSNATTSNATTSNYMDVPPFRTGRPPV
jgi:hypothetical protein